MDIHGVGSCPYLPASREPSGTDPAEVASGIYQPPSSVSDTVLLSDASVERARILSYRMYEDPTGVGEPAGEAGAEKSGPFSLKDGDVGSVLRAYRSFSGAGIESASLVNKYI